jgi:transcriptional regulator with XRE-family HTH domain
MAARPVDGLTRLRRPNPVYGSDYRALVAALVAARRRAGLSQRELARALARSPSHVARIEAGQRRIDVLELCAMAAALRLTPEVLFSEMMAQLRAQ